MLSRRRFVAGLASGLSLAWPGAALPAPALRKSDLREWLLQALPPVDRTYDPLARMLVISAVGGSGEYSKIRTGNAHAPRPSLAYAAALFDTQVPWRLVRAREILRSVLPLQDQNPESGAYGLWPWYLEELKMPRPDPDTGDFCCASLLMVWTAHREALAGDLAGLVREAILHAARSIQRRDVSPACTHSAIAGTGIMLAVAQEFKDPELRIYAKARLHRLYEYVIRQGSLDEYNSPVDTMLVLQELARMALLLHDARDRPMVSALHDLAWKHAAAHFHAPTQQWAGPMSRSRETNLAAQPAVLAFLQKATRADVQWQRADPAQLSLEACRLPVACPRKYVKLFARLDAARQVTETFRHAEASPGSLNPVVGTTWLHPRFALGSINRGDLWSQRRPLVVHWGTPEAPRFLRVRFLKDHQDFSSALFFSVQHQGHLLAAVIIATDHGDRHPQLDPIPEGTIRAQDLRLSLQFGGELGHCTVRRNTGPDSTLVIADDRIRFILTPVADRFANHPWRWDEPDLKLADHIDAVAHAGAEQTFALAKLGDTFLCFTLSEWPADQAQPPPSQPEVRLGGGRFHARWTAGGKTLDLNVPSAPATFASLNDSFRAVVV